MNREFNAFNILDLHWLKPECTRACGFALGRMHAICLQGCEKAGNAALELGCSEVLTPEDCTARIQADCAPKYCSDVASETKGIKDMCSEGCGKIGPIACERAIGILSKLRKDYDEL